MDKLLEKIEQKVFLPAGIVSIFIMTCLTTFDAGGRYLLNMPIPGSYEITEKFLMVACFYFAISYAYREGVNIRITLLVTRLPNFVRLFLNYMIQIMAIFYCLSLSLTSFICNLPRLSEKVFQTNYTLPLMPVYLLVPIALMILTLRMILDLRQIKYGKSGLFKEEETEDSHGV
jgi:TRAP-type C4-dicarboxylate transport system permease small subunit